MKPTQQRTEEGEKLWVEPRPHLAFHGFCSPKTTGRYAYNERLHDKCVPYLPASRVTALELELERAKNALKEAEADLCGYASEQIANDPLGGDLGWIRQSQAEETIRVLALVRAALRDLGEGQ